MCTQDKNEKPKNKLTAEIIPSEICIFYSWQSDVKINKSLIKDAIGRAAIRIEEEKEDEELHIVVDEATRDRPGSPNIPITIMEKIKTADVFICDITTINSDAPPDSRKTPNPNVLIELGYAIAHLGWDRIILLFNGKFGKFPDDCPFDIDRQRASPFEYKLPLKDEPKLSRQQIEQLKKPLNEMIYEALKLILNHNPLKPNENYHISPNEKKRTHDILVLKALLSGISLPILENHIQSVPLIVMHPIFHFWEDFHGRMTNSLFYIYDKKLWKLLDKMHEYWNVTVSHGEQYSSEPFSNKYIFSQYDMFMSEEVASAWRSIEQAAGHLKRALSELVAYIKENYLEIDIIETSTIAWNEYAAFMAEDSSAEPRRKIASIGKTTKTKPRKGNKKKD